MRKADEILKDLKEAQYQVYNKQEETEEGLTPENRQTYNSEDIRNMFMGTLLTGNFKGDKLWGSLREAINKMSDEWVLEFLKVVNGDTVEKVNESIEKVTTKEDQKLRQKAQNSLDELSACLKALKKFIGNNFGNELTKISKALKDVQNMEMK